jgi:simple sugar transport system ATP-binding protein
VLIPQEVDALFAALGRLRGSGLSVIFISHKLKEVMAISDRVTVLRDGRVAGSTATTATDVEQLARMMVGRETFGVTRQGERAPCDAVLQVEGLCANDDRGLAALKGLSLTVEAGEVLGLAGVGGNGQRELAEALCGVRRPTGGRIVVCGRELTAAGPAGFTAAGVGRIPEDRHAGAVGELTVAENLALERLSEFTRGGVLDRDAILRHADALIAQFQIKARPTDRARTLSGGNLQKVLLARVFAGQPKVVIAPQPTRGLDVGATEYVRGQLLAQRERGAAVLLISEDLDEILALADRIAVIYEGEIVGVVAAQDADVATLGLMMAGAMRGGRP